jgi:signal transduction histidine kinase/ligand-binding sensor domain-containing protein
MGRSGASLRVAAAGLVLALVAAPRASALDPSRPPSRYGHDVWLTRDGLPQEFVQAVTQTSDGYLWIGSLGGLVRFDGVRFTVFDPGNTPGLRDARILALCPGRDGSLWIGTASGGVARLAGGVIQPFGAAAASGDRSLKYVRSLYEASDGSLWVGTSGGGVRRFRDGRRVAGEEPASPGHTVTAILEDRRGNLWFGTTEGLAMLQGTRMVRYDAGAALPHPYVYAIFEDRAGTIWVGTRGGLTRIKDGVPTTLTRKNGFPAEAARTMWEDRHGNLWVGTLGQGLLRMNGEGFASFAGQDGLSNDHVICLHEDREGSLWAGTQKGLNRLKDVRFTSYTTHDGLSHDSVNSLLRTRDDSVWVGTDGGGLDRIKDGHIRVFTSRDGLGSDYVGPLFEDREGNVWAGGDGYVSRVAHDRITTFRTDVTGPGRFVSLLGEDAGGHLLVGVGDQPLMWFDSGRLRPYEAAANRSQYRFSVIRDRKGALWFGTVEGLGRYQDGRYVLYAKKDGLPDDTVHSVFEDGQGALWIATAGGLCAYHDGRFVSFAGPDGLGGDVVSQVLEDDAGQLWMNGRRGIVRVRKQDLEAYAARGVSPVPSTVYGVEDGMESADYNSAYIQPAATRTADGRLWFATTKGVAVIDPHRLETNALPPPVVIERVSSDDDPLPLPPGVRIPPGREKFEFHYTALSFLSPGKVRFRYFLEGFDEDWTEAHDRRAAYYTNLPPGRYRFRVKAANNDGVWNEDGASFAFQLLPRFHQTRAFQALVVVLLGLAAWSVHRMRLARVEARFAAVMTERNRMARELHDSLAQGLAGIALHAGALRKAEPALTDTAGRHLDTIGRLVQSSLAEARGSVWDLQPELLRDGDLAAALASMARELTGDTPVRTVLEVRGTPRRLERQTERNVFRVGQEALTNALKHAGSGSVEMRLSFEPDRVELRVRDHGRGFDPGAHAGRDHTGYGLTSMRERAEQIGGRVTITSRPGGGTEVVLEAPVS